MTALTQNSPPSSHSLITNIKADLLPSVVVFLVALPLCMGIALASGVPVSAGLVTGIIGGIVVGSLAGSPFQVSGPAAGLTVLVFAFVQQQGLESLGLAVLIAGVLQMVAGCLRAGQWFRAVAPSVVHGMLSGIGVLIFASQFHVMIDSGPKGSGLKNLKAIPQTIMLAVESFSSSVAETPKHYLAAGVALVTIAVILAWPKVPVKRLKVIPPQLIAVLSASALAGMLTLPIKFVDVPDKLLEPLMPPTMKLLSEVDWKAILIGAATIALVASAETLLCCVAVDQMQSKIRTKYDRELFAQGVGNFLCGCLGALPMTGVIVRSAANVQAGASSRASAILHGIWLAVFVLLLGSLLRLIPTSCLAAMLVVTGYKLMNFKVIKMLKAFGGRGEVFVYLATVATIVLVDLLSGVVTGIVLSAMKLLIQFGHLEVRLNVDQANRRGDLHLLGAATFLKLPILASQLEKIPNNVVLHVHLDELASIDHACLELLMGWKKQHEAQGGTLVIDWEQLSASFGRELPQTNIGH